MDYKNFRKTFMDSFASNLEEITTERLSVIYAHYLRLMRDVNSLTNELYSIRRWIVTNESYAVLLAVRKTMEDCYYPLELILGDISSFIPKDNEDSRLEMLAFAETRVMSEELWNRLEDSAKNEECRYLEVIRDYLRELIAAIREFVPVQSAPEEGEE